MLFTSGRGAAPAFGDLLISLMCVETFVREVLRQHKLGCSPLYLQSLVGILMERTILPIKYKGESPST